MKGYGVRGEGQAWAHLGLSIRDEKSGSEIQYLGQVSGTAMSLSHGVLRHCTATAQRACRRRTVPGLLYRYSVEERGREGPPPFALGRTVMMQLNLCLLESCGLARHCGPSFDSVASRFPVLALTTSCGPRRFSRSWPRERSKIRMQTHVYMYASGRYLRSRLRSTSRNWDSRA